MVSVRLKRVFCIVPWHGLSEERLASESLHSDFPADCLVLAQKFQGHPG